MASPEEKPGTERELALLSWIQQFAPYGVLTLDTSLRVQTWNRWLESHSSLTAAAVAGRNLFEIFPELEKRRLTAPFQRALEGESCVLSTALHHYLLPLQSPLHNGGSDQMQQTARIAPLLSGGKVCGVIVVIEDVTQREDQADILSRQHRHDEVLSWALVHLLKSDEPRKTARQLFFKIAEHLDFDTFFLYLRDSKDETAKLYTAGGISDGLEERFLDYELLAKVAEAQEPVIFDSIKSRQDPRYALLKEAKVSSAIAIPLRVNDKSLGALCFASWSREHIATEESDLLTTIAQYLATAVDKENTNQELRRVEEANHWMGALVESSDDAIISKDLNGIIKSCNQGAARLYGYEIEELIGKPITMLIPEDHQNEETQIMRRIRGGNRMEHFETVRRRKDGSLVEVSLAVSPVKDAAGKIIGASKIARDITERRRAEQTLAESFQREKQAREQAESANRAKDDFLASLSHELRTPLNPILLIASDASENTNLPPDVKAHFEVIRKNIELEARLIDDLLDLTRITHGKLSLHPRVVDVKTILEDTISNVQSELNEKLIHWKFDFKSPQQHVHGDDVRLQQIFWNVLKNAVKFTPPHGSITLSVELAGENLRISIADTGIGMTAAEIKRVFEAFSQGDHTKSDAHRFGGLGLGLAISRKLVEMHKGKISVTSEGAGRGSTFIIELPVTTPEKARLLLPPATQLDASKGSGSPKCVLLVEDHEHTRVTLAHLLERRGYTVIQAGNAREARAASAAGKIDVVISDIGLPDGSGNELMKHLSTTFGLKGIALTGYGMEEDIEHCLASGFVTHLIKPVSIRSLENALASTLDF